MSRISFIVISSASDVLRERRNDDTIATIKVVDNVKVANPQFRL